MMEREKYVAGLICSYNSALILLASPKAQILSGFVRLFKTHAPLARNSIFGSKILSNLVAFKIYAIFIESVSILRPTKLALACKILFFSSKYLLFCYNFMI